MKLTALGEFLLLLVCAFIGWAALWMLVPAS
jgi:hypothetical protein